MDLPWIFGANQQIEGVVFPGNSGLWLGTHSIEAGVTTEQEWWGPTLVSPLVLGTNAPGIPRFALRSVAPTRLGGLQMAWSYGAGVLTESPWFDTNVSNDYRSWVGGTLQVASDEIPGLSLGVSRAVVGAMTSPRQLPGRFFDMIRGAPSWAAGAAADSGGAAGGREQLTAAWARWVVPGTGFEAYVEAGRQDPIASWREFLVDPAHSRAFTMGLQQAVRGESSLWRIAGELSTLEQGPSYRWRPTGSWYTGRRVLQGYTQRGRSIGSPLGPGGSGQFFWVDRWDARGNSLGMFLERRRLLADAFHVQPWGDGAGYCEMDTELVAGLTRTWRAGPYRLGLEGAVRTRLNVFFQDGRGCGRSPGPVRDLRDVLLAFRVGPSASSDAVDTPRHRAATGAGSTGYRAASDWVRVAMNAEERAARVQDVATPSASDAWWSLRAGPLDRGSRMNATRWWGEAWVRHAGDAPWALNDHGVWGGRGLTAAAMGGFIWARGRLTISLAPQAAWSANRPFALTENGVVGLGRFADWHSPDRVDVPQRMGDRPYVRIRGGQSAVSVDAIGLRLALTTASAWWGPATVFPFVLSTHAPGIPRVEIATRSTWTTPVGAIRWRWFWGELESSPWFIGERSPTTPRRFATAAALAWKPRALDGLELGATRFFHFPWRSGTTPPSRQWLAIWQGLLKSSLPIVGDGVDDRSRDGENQLASLFARWRPAAGGVELYGEVGRDDHAFDLRDLLVSPDQQASLMIGAARAWRSGSRTWEFRVEGFDAVARSVDRRRGGSSIYTHALGARQGHTLDGMLLGAGIGVGNPAGFSTRLTLVEAGGQATAVEWLRLVRGIGRPLGSSSSVMPWVEHLLRFRRDWRCGQHQCFGTVDGRLALNARFVEDRAGLVMGLGVAGWR